MTKLFRNTYRLHCHGRSLPWWRRKYIPTKRP